MLKKSVEKYLQYLKFHALLNNEPASVYYSAFAIFQLFSTGRLLAEWEFSLVVKQDVVSYAYIEHVHVLYRF